jgi:hypothetical protein
MAFAPVFIGFAFHGRHRGSRFFTPRIGFPRVRLTVVLNGQKPRIFRIVRHSDPAPQRASFGTRR